MENQKPTIVALAEDVAADGVANSRDGMTLMQILDLLYRGLPKGAHPNEEAELYLMRRLAEFDYIFNWVWPGKNPAAEEFVYMMYAKMYMMAKDKVDFWAKEK